MKSFTDLEQSKTLAEILPIDSADMRYTPFGDKNPWVWSEEPKLLEKGAIPCWSLTALYNILPNNEIISTSLFRDGLDKWMCEYDASFKIVPSMTNVFATTADNPIDACYEMIIQIHELNPRVL